MRLQRAILFVKNLPLMVDFYQTSFGLTPIPETRTGEWAEFDAEGTILALHAVPAHIASDIEIAQPPVPRERTPIKLCFAVDDVQAERARLEALGVQVIQRHWGDCDAIDPEGNIVQLCARPDPCA
jgi:predicted enzyme related to lactoylglutathione lyase